MIAVVGINNRQRALPASVPFGQSLASALAMAAFVVGGFWFLAGVV
jgi:hypothetical protein